MTTLARSSPIRIVQLVLQGLVALIFLVAGLLNLTKAWAKELGPHGVLVNAVCPGYIGTEMVRAVQSLRNAGTRNRERSSRRMR